MIGNTTQTGSLMSTATTMGFFSSLSAFSWQALAGSTYE